MQVADYLYDILRKHEGAVCTSYFVDGKRYAIAAMPPFGNRKAWSYVLCRVNREKMFEVTSLYETAEAAWEEFLFRNHSDVLAKWEAAESGK